MISASLLALAVPAAGHTAMFTSDPTTSSFRVSGFIDLGDGQRFVDAMTTTRRTGTVRTIVLDSPGGSISDALTMADAVWGATTTTVPGGMCASACVLVLASGQRVSIAPGSRVGVHQGRSAAGAVAWGDSYRMAAFLADRHVDHAVTAKLLGKAGGDCDWLTANDEMASGWMVDDGTVQPMPPPVPVRSTHVADQSLPYGDVLHHWRSMMGQRVAFGDGREASIDDVDEVSSAREGTLFKVNGGALWVYCSTIRPALAWQRRDGYYAVRLNLTSDAERWAGTTYMAVCHAEDFEPARAGDFGYHATPAEDAPIPAPNRLLDPAPFEHVAARPLDIAPAPAPEVVQVPRPAEAAPAVIPAPAEAAPVLAPMPVQPAMLRPTPAPADLPRTAVQGHCTATEKGATVDFGSCWVGRAADGSVAVQTLKDKAPFYFVPNGADTMLAGDGRTFDVAHPFTRSADRTCVSREDVSLCVFIDPQPATILDGVNRLVAGLFGAAVETEQRLGLLGQ